MRNHAVDPQIFGCPGDDSGKASLLGRICTILLALIPILQHYKGILGQDASTVLLVLLFAFFGCRLLLIPRWNAGLVLPLLAASVFELLNHGVTLMEFAREALLIAYFLAAASGAVDLRYFGKTVIAVAAAASVLIAVQYVCYYLLGFHLQMVPTALLEESNSQWIQLVQTGTISVSGKDMGFYRPSAFFLEPSHLTIYCFPALAMVLLSPGMNRKQFMLALLLSAGILMSTSGMGIVSVMGLWAVYAAFYLGGDRSLRDVFRAVCSRNGLMILGGCLVVFGLAFALVEPFRMSIVRIFVDTEGGRSAISGRTGTGLKKIRELEGIEIWLGKSDWGNVANWNMSGLFYTLYTQGVVGTVLSYLFYLKCALKACRPYFWISLLIMGLSVFTVHTHAAFYMLYYVLILLNGFAGQEGRELLFPNVLAGPAERISEKLFRR